jgi:hypothetical protein
LFKNEVDIEGKILKIEMLIEKGIIVEAKILGDFFTSEIAKQLSEHLQNKKHDFEDVLKVLDIVLIELSEKIVYSFF